jgi:hypothetical protein
MSGQPFMRLVDRGRPRRLSGPEIQALTRDRVDRWKAAQEVWPPVRDKRVYAETGVALFALWLAGASFVVPSTGMRLSLALSGLLIALLGGLFLLIEKYPEDQGKVTSRGKR